MHTAITHIAFPQLGGASEPEQAKTACLDGLHIQPRPLQSIAAGRLVGLRQVHRGRECRRMCIREWHAGRLQHALEGQAAVGHRTQHRAPDTAHQLAEGRCTCQVHMQSLLATPIACSLPPDAQLG